MLTFSLNVPLNIVADPNKVEQYFWAVKQGYIYEEWASQYYLNAVEKEVRKGSADFSAKRNIDWYYQAQVKRGKRLVPIVDNAEDRDTPLNGGIPESLIPDPKAELDYEGVEADLVREDIIKDWLLLYVTVLVLEGYDLVGLLKQCLKDKSTSCCGRIPKRFLTLHPLGETFIYKFTKQEEVDMFNKKYDQKGNPAMNGYTVHVCNCKQVRADRAKKLRNLRVVYKIDDLLLAIFSDSETFRQCLTDFDETLERYDTNFKLTLEEYHEIRDKGFAGKDYF